MKTPAQIKAARTAEAKAAKRLDLAHRAEARATDARRKAQADWIAAVRTAQAAEAEARRNA